MGHLEKKKTVGFSPGSRCVNGRSFHIRLLCFVRKISFIRSFCRTGMSFIQTSLLNSYFLRILPNIKHTVMPTIPRINKTRAAPEPFPTPNIPANDPLGFVCAIHGSQILSTMKPPAKVPMGMVKNCIVFRQE